MTRAQLKELLENDNATVKLGADGKEYCAEPIISISFDDDDEAPEIKAEGFSLKTCGKTSNYKSFDRLFKRFEGTELTLLSINDRFKSIEEYEAKKAFDNISMKGLLEIFAPLSDSFSLTCPFNDGYDRKHKFGIYRLCDNLAATALSQLEKIEKDNSFSEYLQIPEKQRCKLPPFDELYEEIKSECEAYAKANRVKANRFDGNVFFCDEFAEGKTKYRKPQQLWHLYNSADFIQICRYSLDKMRKNTKERPIDAELDDEEYKPLKSSLIKTEVGFAWHCTISGMLSKTFYFRLNDETVKWLEKYENDYALCGLEDLAFYRDGKLLFSSCTHEKFHIKTEE